MKYMRVKSIYGSDETKSN